MPGADEDDAPPHVSNAKKNLTPHKYIYIKKYKNAHKAKLKNMVQKTIKYFHHAFEKKGPKNSRKDYIKTLF